MKQQWRATYEDTLEDQEKHREKLDLLIRENRCLSSDEERGDLLSLTADAYLGEHRDRKINFFVKYPSGTWCHVTNFGRFLGELYYFENNQVPIDFFEEQHGNEIIDISEIWKAIRKESFSIYPKAQDKAIRMSKEREQRDFSSDGGFTFGTKEGNETNR